jgi:hypothetical protein
MTRQTDPLESVVLSGAVRALRRQADVIRKRPSVGVPVLIIADSKAAQPRRSIHCLATAFVIGGRL